jgi:hypothetical protein
MPNKKVSKMAILSVVKLPQKTDWPKNHFLI